MVRRQHAQRSVFEMILPDGDQLWDPELRRIDEVLEDEALIDTLQEAPRRRWPEPNSRNRGWPSRDKEEKRKGEEKASWTCIRI